MHFRKRDNTDSRDERVDITESWRVPYLVAMCLCSVLILFGYYKLIHRRGTLFGTTVTFYVDNGKNLPLWRDLPRLTSWLIPTILGAPLVVRALLRHPLAQRPRR